MCNTIDKCIIITFSIVNNPYPCHPYMFMTENCCSKFTIISFSTPALNSPTENSIPKKPLDMLLIWHMVPEIWSMRTEFCVILNCFLPFYPPNRPKNQIFKKIKRSLEIWSFYTSVPKIMIILLYCSWDMTGDRCNCYFSFWAIKGYLCYKTIFCNKVALDV